MDILNLEGKIDVEFVDNWVQQLESYYIVNQLSEAKNMAEEADDRHATDETEQLIEKSLACQRTEMFSQFSEILM